MPRTLTLCHSAAQAQLHYTNLSSCCDLTQPIWKIFVKMGEHLSQNFGAKTRRPKLYPSTKLSSKKWPHSGLPPLLTSTSCFHPASKKHELKAQSWSIIMAAQNSWRLKMFLYRCSGPRDVHRCWHCTSSTPGVLSTPSAQLLLILNFLVQVFHQRPANTIYLP